MKININNQALEGTVKNFYQHKISFFQKLLEKDNQLKWNIKHIRLLPTELVKKKHLFRGVLQKSCFENILKVFEKEQPFRGVKKCVLKICSKFTEDTHVGVRFQQSYDNAAWVFSCKFASVHLFLRASLKCCFWYW